MSGVIAAGGGYTAEAGAEMLRRGGNAVDAAVAAAFVSFIAEIGVVHLGGSGLAHVFDPATGRSVVYDFFSSMPGLAGDGLRDDLDFEQVTIDFGPTTQDFYLGRGSVAVPGNVFGLCRLAADLGTLPLGVLLEPALRLAREGVALDDFQASTCELLRPLYTHTAGMRAVFMPSGYMIKDGERLFISDLAETLGILAEEGVGVFRSGRVAEALIADQAERGGLVAAEDLAAYEVYLCDSIVVRYGEFEVLLPPPCSSGGVLTAFALKVLAAFDVAGLGHGSVAHLQLLFEVMTAAGRARPGWDELSATLPVEQAIGQFLHGDNIAFYVAQIGEAVANRRPSTLPDERPGVGNTSHLSVLDAQGMAVGITTTAGESAGYVVPGTGYIPNNILGEGDLNPLGFHQWPAGHRINTMMAPTLVMQAGVVRLVIGSGGSERIRSAILQTISNCLDFQLPLEEAVNRARVHVEKGVLQCEAGFDGAAVDMLESWGYGVNRWPGRSIYFGGAHSVGRLASGALVAAGDDRRGGAVAGG